MILRTESGPRLKLMIGHKLALGIGTLLIMYIVLGVYSRLSLERTNEKMKEITDVAEPISSTEYQMALDLREIGLGGGGLPQRQYT